MWKRRFTGPQVMTVLHQAGAVWPCLNFAGVGAFTSDPGDRLPIVSGQIFPAFRPNRSPHTGVFWGIVPVARKYSNSLSCRRLPAQQRRDDVKHPPGQGLAIEMPGPGRSCRREQVAQRGISMQADHRIGHVLRMLGLDQQANVVALDDPGGFAPDAEQHRNAHCHAFKELGGDHGLEQIGAFQMDQRDIEQGPVARDFFL